MTVKQIFTLCSLLQKLEIVFGLPRHHAFHKERKRENMLVMCRTSYPPSSVLIQLLHLVIHQDMHMIYIQFEQEDTVH